MKIDKDSAEQIRLGIIRAVYALDNPDRSDIPEKESINHYRIDVKFHHRVDFIFHSAIGWDVKPELLEMSGLIWKVMDNPPIKMPEGVVAIMLSKDISDPTFDPKKHCCVLKEL